MRARLTATLACVLAAGGPAACGGDGERGGGDVAGDTLTVYASQPLEGRLSGQARDAVRAERLALAQAGGRAGRWRVRLVALNNADARTGDWDPGLVSANARRAAQDDTTIAYLGELDTGASAVSIPVLNETGILAISPTDTPAGFTRTRGVAPGEPEKYYPTGERTFGRLVPPDDIQAQALVSAMQDRRVKRIFLVNDRGFYGRSLSLVVQRRAPAAGIETVKGRGADFDDIATPTTLTREITATAADAVVYTGAPRAGVDAFFRALHAADPKLAIFGPGALVTPAFAALLGPAGDRTTLTSPVLPLQAQPAAARAFARDFRARYGSDPLPEAAYAYEAMSVLLASIRTAGDHGNDRGAVIEAFFATKDRQSVLGRYSIDSAGDTTTQVYASWRIRAGRLVFAGVLDPLGA